MPGISVVWALLREKALFFADELGFGDDFKASDGWIQSVLKAGGKKSVSLHGEGMEMTEEEQVEKHKDFVKVMRQTMEDFNHWSGCTMQIKLDCSTTNYQTKCMFLLLGKTTVG